MTNLESAVELLRAGRRSEAEALVADAAKQAKERFGERSPEYASAEYDLGQVLVGVGDLSGAVAALERAAAVKAEGPQAQKARLNYGMNLGELLRLAGRFPEARKVLEQGLAEREAFYGKGSQGHAFGQEKLADLLLAQGELEAAEALAEEALGVLWKAGNVRAVELVALRAAVRAARYGDERPLLERLEDLPPELKKLLAEACINRANRDAPGPTLWVLQELRERLEDHSDLAALLEPVVGTLSNVARVAGRHEERQEALGWLCEEYVRRGSAVGAMRAWMALALARDEAGNVEGAEQAYQEATRRADELGDAAASAQVRRNAGLFHAQRKAPQKADPLLSEAVAHAEKTGNALEVGKALVARGVFLQHEKRLDEARPLLQRAIASLPPAHPDGLVARNHLEAIEKQGACGCGDMRSAISRALEAMVRQHLPEGLLKSIELESGGQNGFRIELSRAPTEEERAALERALRQGMAELRERAEGRGSEGGQA